MLKIDDDIKGIDIDIQLSENERAIVAAGVKQEFFVIIQKLMRDQVKKFNIKLHNTRPEKTEEVLAAHRMSLGVAQFYVEFINRINQEIETFSSESAPEIETYGMEELR